MKTALQEIRALKPAQVGGIKRIYESFGTGRDGIHRVARTFHISESAASTMATAVSTAPKPKPVTESAPDLTAAAAASDARAASNAQAAHAARDAYLTAELAAQVQAAAAKPLNECSPQELEALAAAAGAEAGMFG